MAVAATLPTYADTRPSVRAVRNWLVGLALLVGLMIVVGGATRLTGSGLSITEWKPVTGAIPPLSDAAWGEAFEKYRASSQYRNLNQGMSLAEFKSIYAWEWGHRQLGRLVGLYAILPLLWFWWRGAISARFGLGLLGIATLGGLQAGIGWVMVASGLEPGMVAVAPVKLTLHLLGASLILGLIVWVATGLAPSRPSARRGIARPALAAGVLALVTVQVGLGGLVAGLRAGLTYNTWPMMDGRLVPTGETLWSLRPAIENIVANPALVQFDHRVVAYLVVAMALWQAWRHLRDGADSAPARRAATIALLALGQMALGIATLILVVPLPAALAHQALAMALLAAATWHLRRTLMERPIPRGD